ncbi:MAG: tail fiber domain-containing protein [Leadbetterella sp.]
MKKILSFFILQVYGNIYGQSIELKPGLAGYVKLPVVNWLECNPEDKGKMAFFDWDNSIRICNGTDWVRPKGVLELPYYQSEYLSNSLFDLTNTNPDDGDGVHVKIQSTDNNSAIIGEAKATSPTFDTKGIQGINYSTNTNGHGIYGAHYGGGEGVVGSSVSGKGVEGYSLSGNAIFGFSSTGAAGYFVSGSGPSLLTGTGKVGIGLATPDQLLDVNGRIRIRHNGNTAGIWMSNSTNGLGFADGAFYGMKTDTETGIWIGNNWRFWVTNSGNATLVGTLTQSSDQRLKKDFSYLQNSLSNLSQLKGYHYKWIDTDRSQDLQTGLIAQEVQKIFPELVQTDNKGLLSVNYIGLVPHLIEAVKELRDENNMLKLKNENFENSKIKIENDNKALSSRLDQIETMLKSIQPEKQTYK